MRIYVTIPSWKSKKLMNLLKEKAEVVIADKRPTQSEFQQIIKDYDGAIIGRLHDINKEVLENSNLKFVGLVAKGTNNIDIEECKKHNVSVFYTPEANLTSVAEHVFALILAFAKNLFQLDKNMRNDEFDKFRLTTTDIRDKTLGVIGAGPISKEVIKRAKTFEMNILCYTKHPENHSDLDVKFVPLEKLLRNSDYVSVNIPLTEETHNFLDSKELALMKPTSYLINTSRGKVVNEQSLIDALNENVIAGAGIDVFEEEPTHNKKLFELKNAILTPHVGGVSKEALDRMEEHLITDILAFLDQKDVKYRLI